MLRQEPSRISHPTIRIVRVWTKWLDATQSAELQSTLDGIRSFVLRSIH